MRLATLFFLLSAACLAQSLTLTSSAVSATPGAQVLLTIGYADALPTAGVAGVQWTLISPSALIVGAGLAALPTKPLTCNLLTCLAIGDGTALNSSALATGSLATFPVTVSAGAIPGPVVISFTGALGASAAGAPVALTTPTLTLTILSRYDLNADGAVTLADVQLAAQQADGLAPCTNGNLLADGCSIADVELVILAALGTIH